MSERVVIDIEARFTDKTQGVRSAQAGIEGLSKSAKEAQKSIGGLGGKKASPKIDADASNFEKAMKKTEDKMGRFGRSRAEATMSVKDRASEYISRAAAKAKSFAGRAYNAYLNIKGSDAMKSLGEIGSGLKNLVSKAWRVTVSLADKVTAPVRRLVGSLNSVLGLAGMGLSSYGLVIKPVQMQVEYQDLITQFEVLLGSADAAQKRIEELTSFAGQTPFTRDELYKASRILEVYTEGSLSKPDSPGGMKMVGDIAAGTNTDYLSVATWTGRLYSALKGGRSVGEMTAALQEMGALSAEARNRIEALAESGKDISQIWPQVTKEFSRFDDIMLKQSDNLGNLLLGVKSFVSNNILKKLGSGISDSLTPFLKDFRQWRSDNKELIAGWAEQIESFASKVSGQALGAVKRLASTIQESVKSDKFKEADGFWGKAKVLWDDVIGKPLSEWWNGSGKAKVVEMANNIGKFLGQGITAAVLAVFGIESDLLGEGMDVGRSFLDGFKEGFKGEEVASAIWGGMKRFFDAHPFVSLLLGGMGLAKLANSLTPILSPVSKVISGVTGITGSAVAGKLGTSVISNLIGTTAGMAGTRVVAGGLMNGATMSAGTAAGMGLAGVTGGLAGGLTLMSAGNDIYKGYRADSSYDKKHSYIKGGTKIAGVGAGAAIGTAILPGVGSLIGAGVGGLVGWLGSTKLADKIMGTKKNLDKYGAASSEAARRLEELDRKQAELAASTLDKKFGDISLSADEVTRAVNNLFNQQQTTRINSASTALSQVSASFENLKTADATFKKELWMTSIQDGAKLTTEEIDSLKTSVKTYGDASKQYITDNQYAARESTVALLGNSKAAKEIIQATGTYYTDQRSKISKYQSELTSKLNEALKDGKIDINEQESLDNIRMKIAKITNEIANEDYQADMEVIKLKLEADIDWESFQKVMKQAQKAAQERIDILENAYGHDVTAVKKGKGTKDEKAKKIEQLKWGDDLTGHENGLMKQKVDIELEIVSIGLDKVKSKFKKELKTKTFDLGADISKIMKEGPSKNMRQAIMEISNDPSTQAAMGQMLKQMKPSEKAMQELAQAYADAGKEVPKEFSDAIKSYEFLEALTEGTDSALKWLNDPKNRIKAEPEVDVDPKVKKGKRKKRVRAADLISKNASGTATVTAKVEGEGKVVKKGKVRGSELTNKTAKSTVIAKVAAKKQILNKLSIKASDFGVPDVINKTVHVNVTSDYQGPKQEFRGGIVGSGSILGFAGGGFAKGGPMLATLAEEGTPEAIIPLGRHRRERALELFGKVGSILDVPGFAAGGFAGGTIGSGSSGRSGSGTVKVDVGGITIKIEARDGQSLLDSIRENENEITEVIAGVMHKSLGGQWSNTPAKGGAS